MLRTPVGARPPGAESHHLLVDVPEVHQPGIPELKLDSGQGVQPIQQGLG